VEASSSLTTFSETQRAQILEYLLEIFSNALLFKRIVRTGRSKMYSKLVKQGKPLILFLSYAHDDESLLQELETYLILLRKQKPGIIWNNQRMGAEWTEVNHDQLEQASIVLLLVSPDFLASDDCYKIALRAQQRQETDQIPVIPILLRPACLQSVPFKMHALLPSNGKPITEWIDHYAAFDDVMQGILATILP
jgi:TIR domain